MQQVKAGPGEGGVGTPRRGSEPPRGKAGAVPGSGEQGEGGGSDGRLGGAEDAGQRHLGEAGAPQNGGAGGGRRKKGLGACAARRVARERRGAMLGEGMTRRFRPPFSFRLRHAAGGRAQGGGAVRRGGLRGEDGGGQRRGRPRDPQRRLRRRGGGPGEEGGGRWGRGSAPQSRPFVLDSAPPPPRSPVGQPVGGGGRRGWGGGAGLKAKGRDGGGGAGRGVASGARGGVWAGL